MKEKDFLDILEHFEACDLAVVDRHYPEYGEFECSKEFLLENAESCGMID